MGNKKKKSKTMRAFTSLCKDIPDESLYGADDTLPSLDLCDDDNDYDADYNDVYLPPIRTVQEHGLKNKRTVGLDSLAKELIWQRGLKTTEGGQVMRYDAESGSYRYERSTERMIARLLDEQDSLSALSNRDLHDLCERITWDAHAQCSSNQFNNNPLLINMQDGILNFETDVVMEHSPEHCFTYCVDAHYRKDPLDIHCPNFEAFCNSSLGPQGDSIALDRECFEAIFYQKRLLLLEIIGYCCCDSNAGKCALFLKGEPDTGKSVMANFILKLFSPELVSNITLHKLSDRFAKAELFCKKINVAGEIQGKKLSEIATFKSVTGGDAIFAEFKGRDIFSFIPRCKLLFAGNTLPSTLEADATKAFVNRLVVLLFNRSIPKEEQDKHLLDKLWDERSSIFTLAMHALRDLHNRKYQFTIPDESREFINSFAERGNSLQAFLKDCCILAHGMRVHNIDLNDAYVKYCTKNGLEPYCRNKLYEMLSGIPGVSMKRMRIGDKNLWGHEGITIKKE